MLLRQYMYKTALTELTVSGRVSMKIRGKHWELKTR